MIKRSLSMIFNAHYSQVAYTTVPRVEVHELVRGLPFLNTLNKTDHDPSTTGISKPLTRRARETS